MFSAVIILVSVTVLASLMALWIVADVLDRSAFREKLVGMIAESVICVCVGISIGCIQILLAMW